MNTWLLKFDEFCHRRGIPPLWSRLLPGQRTVILCLVLFLKPAFCVAQSHIPESQFIWNSEMRELDYGKRLKTVKQLDPAVRAALIKAISGLLRPQMADLEITSEKELREIALQSRVKFVDLDEDGTDEVIVQPFGKKTPCGVTGNCPFWVFAKSGEAYRLMIEGDAAAEMYRIEPQRTNGFHNLALAIHDTAVEKHIFIYQFRSARYRASKCYDAWWVRSSYDSKRLKHPIITPCKLSRTPAVSNDR
jgi:hypothetical protein